MTWNVHIIKIINLCIFSCECNVTYSVGHKKQRQPQFIALYLQKMRIHYYSQKLICFHKHIRIRSVPIHNISYKSLSQLLVQNFLWSKKEVILEFYSCIRNFLHFNLLKSIALTRATTTRLVLLCCQISMEVKFSIFSVKVLCRVRIQSQSLKKFVLRQFCYHMLILSLTTFNLILHLSSLIYLPLRQNCAF